MNMVAFQKKYTECLNDLVDYFIVGDIDNITRFKAKHLLSDDLCHEFTNISFVNDPVETGVILPMRGIKNFPYTVYFNTQKTSIFSSLESDIQHQQKGYVLEVVSGRVYLLTMPILKAWSKNTDLIRRSKPYLDIKNGWYGVEVVCGETLQDTGWEPTIEYTFQRYDTRPNYEAKDNYAFEIISREY